MFGKEQGVFRGILISSKSLGLIAFRGSLTLYLIQNQLRM